MKRSTLVVSFSIFTAILTACIILLILMGYSIGLLGTDFQNQYLQYLNYFKDLFHDNHVLFPQLVFGYGMIQNGANFIYYGLFNPIFIIQRILGIDGLVYLNLIYITTILTTLVLAYKLISNHVNNSRYAVIASLLVCSNAFLINSLTYQVVFSMYLPFFLVGLLAIYYDKKIIFYIVAMLIFNINYLMAIAVFIMYLIYTIYCSKSWVNTLLILVLASFSSLYIVLPTFYSIGMATRMTPNHYLSFQDCINTILQYFGYSFIPVICFFGLALGRRDKILLSTVLIFGLLPFAPYVSSLGTSDSHRFFVLLLPFIGIIIAKVFENIKNIKLFYHKFFILLILSYISILYVILHPNIEIRANIYLIIIYMGLIFVALALEYLNKKKFVLSLIGIASILNIVSFTQISEYKGSYKSDQELSTSDNLFLENKVQFENYKNEYNTSGSQVSMYSSLVNKNYINFLYDYIQLPIRFYREVGFIYSSSKLTDAVLGIEPQIPMVYGRYDMCSNDTELSKLDRTLVMLSNDFSEDGNKSCTPIESEYTYHLENYTLSKSAENKLVQYKDFLSDYVVYLNFDVPEDEGTIGIEIDSQLNEYKPLLKFKHVNSNFTYYLDGTGDYNIKINSSLDDIPLSNISIRLYKKSALVSRYQSSSRILPNSIDVNQKLSEISFNLDMKEKGWLVTKIPFDPGFDIYVNNQKTELTKIDDSFIGVNLDEGVNSIVIKYSMPLLKVGIICSIISIIISINYFRLSKYSIKDKT